MKRRILHRDLPVLSAGYYGAYYKKALQVKALIKNAFSTAFQQSTICCSPGLPHHPPRWGTASAPLRMPLSDIYTVPLNLAGLPAISCPAGSTPGHAHRAQLIGPSWETGPCSTPPTRFSWRRTEAGIRRSAWG